MSTTTFFGAYLLCKKQQITIQENQLVCPQSTSHISPHQIKDEFGFCPICGSKLKLSTTLLTKYDDQCHWDLIDQMQERLRILSLEGTPMDAEFDIYIENNPNLVYDPETDSYNDTDSSEYKALEVIDEEQVHLPCSVADIEKYEKTFEFVYAHEIEMIRKKYESVTLLVGVLVEHDF